MSYTASDTSLISPYKSGVAPHSSPFDDPHAGDPPEPKRESRCLNCLLPVLSSREVGTHLPLSDPSVHGPSSTFGHSLDRRRLHVLGTTHGPVPPSAVTHLSPDNVSTLDIVNDYLTYTHTLFRPRSSGSQKLDLTPSTVVVSVPHPSSPPLLGFPGSPRA